MKNPTAWISKSGALFKELPPAPMDLEPLYLIKELTDEEIVNVWHEYQGEDRRPFVNFARAILRKAQEK
jgi:hypothetical protein